MGRPDEQTVPTGLEAGLSLIQHSDREVRRTAAEAVTTALAPGLRTRAFVYNTLALDKSVDDRLRSYDNWISVPRLWVDPAGRRIRYHEPPQPGWIEILAMPYRMVLYLHGRDHLQEFPPAQRMVERIKAWSYQIDHDADPENLLREGPGQDNIDLRFSLDPDEDISVPPFGAGFLTEDGVWGLEFEVKVPTFLMVIGEEGYWQYLLSLNDAPERPTDPDEWPAWQQDPAVRNARTCWDLTTMVFGAGAVQAVAWDQASWGSSSSRTSSHRGR